MYLKTVEITTHYSLSTGVDWDVSKSCLAWLHRLWHGLKSSVRIDPLLLRLALLNIRQWSYLHATVEGLATTSRCGWNFSLELTFPLWRLAKENHRTENNYLVHLRSNEWICRNASQSPTVGSVANSVTLLASPVRMLGFCREASHTAERKQKEKGDKLFLRGLLSSSSWFLLYFCNRAVPRFRREYDSANGVE